LFPNARRVNRGAPPPGLAEVPKHPIPVPGNATFAAVERIAFTSRVRPRGAVSVPRPLKNGADRDPARQAFVPWDEKRPTASHDDI
jgi:hypothetical protein